MSLTASTEWAALKAHHEEAKKMHIRDLFTKDGDRFKKFKLVILSHIDNYTLIVLNIAGTPTVMTTLQEQ